MPMPKVEIFCGGVQVTIERTKFVQMTNVGGVTKECHQSNLLIDKRKSAK